MVFELTDELARCPQNRWRELTLCISNLLIGYYEGNILLMASNLFCRFIEERDLAGGYREQIALNYLRNNNGFRPDVLWHIRVVLDHPNVNNHELDISFFNKTESVQPSSFLCEHIIDIHFYMRQAYLYHPDSPMKAIERCGGGGATVDVFKSIKSKNIICLTILDSDCKYPGCPRPPKGTTAYRCDQNYKNRLANVELIVLPVHEIENLVPISFMHQRTDADGERFLRKLERNNCLNLMVFYDVKLGITKEGAIKSAEIMNFARDIYNMVYPKRQTFEVYLNHKKEKDYLHPALGADMLKEYMEDKLKNYQPDMFDTYRKEIADIVYTFMCCRGSTPIN